MTYNCINFENNTLLEAKIESVFIRIGLSNSCWLNAKSLFVGIVNYITLFSKRGIKSSLFEIIYLPRSHFLHACENARELKRIYRFVS